MVESHLHHAQEESKQATQTLKQVQGKNIKQHRIEEHEKVYLQAKFEAENEQM
jgi:hypothetical protein